MVNPGTFQGSRKAFLQAQFELYADAVVNNNVADTIADIQRRYFKRYPITLPHDEEPSEDWLAQVDDSAPDEDFLPPNLQALDADGLNVAQAAYDEKLKLIQLRKDQISRRLKYQHSKTTTLPTDVPRGIEDPMFVLMARLTGIDPKKPRRKTGYNLWAPSNRPTLNALVNQRAIDMNITGKKKIGLRNKIYKEAYDELDDEEKKEWETKAKIEHEKSSAMLEASLDAPPSTEPADRQNVIEGLPAFVQPIIDLIAEYTGWKVTVIAGGPEPADNGRLNIVSMHSGHCSGPVPMTFGRAERGPYKQFVIPVFANFLKKCYTVEECRAASLPAEHKSLAAMLNDVDGSWEVHNSEDFIRPSGPSRSTFSTPHPVTPRPPLRIGKENELASHTPVLYKIPTKVGPPIHARKESTTSTTPFVPSLAASRHMPAPLQGHPQVSNILTSAVTSEPRQAIPHAPSPASTSMSISGLYPQPSHALSPPAQSRAQSPAPSCAPSPAPSRALSPSPSRAQSPTPQFSAQSVPTQQNRSVGKCGRGASDTEDLGPRTRSRVSRMHADAEVNACNIPNSSTNTASTSFPVPSSDCPDWFSKALDLLASKHLSREWVSLVNAWARFEVQSNYTEIKVLGSHGRPLCVAEWIRYTRSPTYRPRTFKLDMFEKSFSTWWHGLQPEWRIGDGRDLLRGDRSLDSIKLPGKNGLLSILAALFFWGIYAEKKEGKGGVASWSAAVDDVSWVLNRLIV
ncbi:hypothetical protein BDN70DRAFT_939839 [Pholiota conissans]|uniref:Uncharacterized protein n=1 Tax=Pholiota conissans TaxID=109636 RepID=A0A9P5YJK2_9AGAR|nr:hypothetical protein BDN70DRAFT_939839 [Pholiota conissans]